MPETRTAHRALAVSVLLAIVLHVDWHVARPADQRLSLDWPYHWIATAVLFALGGWLVARIAPAPRWSTAAMVFAGAVILA